MITRFTNSEVSLDLAGTKIPARTGAEKGYITPEALLTLLAANLPTPPAGVQIVALTMAEYDALEPKDPAVYYDIIDAPWEP